MYLLVIPATAAAKLAPAAALLWPPLIGREPVATTVGVRVTPKTRTHLGKLPLAGRVHGALSTAAPPPPSTPRPTSPHAVATAAADGDDRGADRGRGRGDATTPSDDTAAVASSEANANLGNGKELGGLPPPPPPAAAITNTTEVWALTALGSRGLIHHAYLADCLARAILTGDETAIPKAVRMPGPSTQQARRQ